MNAHRVGIISDTHGWLRREVTDVLETCEAVLHAGDIGDPGILERLKEICPTFAVAGNVDEDWQEEPLPKPPVKWEQALFGYRICMVHNVKDLPLDLSEVDIAVYGHSHRAQEKRLTDPLDGETLYLNPGSCGPRRFRQPVTMMVLTLYEGEKRMEAVLIDFISEEAERKGETKLPDQDLHRLVKKIMKDVNAGRNVAEIAARNHVDNDLAEQICRMYLTHPGVDADGVIDRIKIKK